MNLSDPFLDGSDEGVVLFWCLHCDAEEGVVEPLDVRGVADKDAVLCGKPFFKSGGATYAQATEENVGV